VSEDVARRGYFSPESAVWRIARESVLMLGDAYRLDFNDALKVVAPRIGTPAT
jgi:hypothetical protein